MDLQIKIINERATLPVYKTTGSAGMDLHACLAEGETITVKPNEFAPFKMGFAAYISNPNFVGMIFPRSGMATKQGGVMRNTVGIIDSDYQGELIINLMNIGTEDIVVSHGDRIAQYVLVPVVQAQMQVVEEFTEETERGAGGFGSTGK